MVFDPEILTEMYQKFLYGPNIDRKVYEDVLL